MIANGHGEDSIAASLIARFPGHVETHAYPVMGDGAAFSGICTLAGPRLDLPSQGSRVRGGTVAGDLPAIARGLPRALGFLRAARRRYDRVVVVGDMTAIYLARLCGLRVSVYLDVYKYGASHRYSALERKTIARVCETVYCRDEALAASLRAHDIDAASGGNVMMDTLDYGQYDAQAKRRNPLAIALLPGSRAGTAEAMAIQIAAIERLRRTDLDLFAALAPGIEPDQIASATGLDHRPPFRPRGCDLGVLMGRGGLIVHLTRGAVGNVLEASDVVLSQAGTATQQALGLGKPVISMRSPGTRAKRVTDEAALMGRGRVLVEEDAGRLASALRTLLDNPGERARIAAVMPARIGGAGTLAAVVESLFG
ncbi:hypothetical protein [Pelagibacterium montanilacus]|uniref:hypothetical protein n=1 Tax=Pelagibacterium montanilacus TaxID=2185280 RepID=UPI000F8E388B|nr:hypothetical protein [Pelagibacterium montanilacus]